MITKGIDILFALRRKYVALFPRIRTLCFILLYRCNLRCSYCDLWKIDEDSRLSIPVIDGILDRMEKPPMNIEFSGGEPFLHEDIAGLYRRIRERLPSSNISITTNGTRLEEIAQFMGSIGDFGRFSFTISTNGTEKDIIKNIDSADLASINKVLEFLNRKYPSVKKHIKMVIDEFEYGEIEALYDYARINCCSLQLKFRENAVSYTGRLRENDSMDFESPPFMLRYSPEEKHRIASGLKRFLKKTSNSRILLLSNRLYLQNVVRYLFDGKVVDGKCPAPGNYLMVLPDGTLYPCRYHTYRLDSPDPPLEKKVIDFFRNAPGCPYPGSACPSFWNLFI